MTTRLSSAKILEEKGTQDSSRITSVALTHGTLSDVSCLTEFKNLEKLDLGFNNLTSLEGLKDCVNLKWLSVIQNKLQTLQGIQGLTKLTVLNAGKNQLTSMDEVQSVVTLRALILNDNEIMSVCQLDQLKELNTLVLSKNPVRGIGKSLEKGKSISKLSLSHCQLQTLGSSLKYCSELKELRLANNDLSALPSELSNNVKIQTLDLGNNSITHWSDLKVLNSLVNLKNLNLHGNPIAEKDKFVNKVKRLLPNLQILNSKPIDKYTSNKHANDEETAVPPISKSEIRETEANRPKETKKVKHQRDTDIKHGQDDLSEKKSKNKKKKTSKDILKTESKHDGSSSIDKDSKKKSKKLKEGGADAIDDTDTPFSELFACDPEDLQDASKNLRSIQNTADVATVSITSKKKKGKSLASGSKALELLAPTVDIGLGGPSAWE